MSTGEIILSIFGALNFAVGAGGWLRLGGLNEAVSNLNRRVSRLEIQGGLIR